MPIYTDIYHSYLGSTPTSYSQPSYSLPSYSSSYTPTYSTPSYTPYSPSPRITSSLGGRYLPKLTTITETPLTKHRLAALTRITSSPRTVITRHMSPKYIAPRPRRIDTSEIDVSAQRFANRRISEVKATEITEIVPEVQKEESVDVVPMKGGRSTIRRDRGLVRLHTTRLRSKSKSPPPIEPVKEEKIIKEKEKSVDTDMGYGSSERSSSGSWRNMFEGELDLYDRKVASPTAKTPGENFLEKYHIKDIETDVNMHYLTLDDVPIERRDSVRRRSGPMLPSFKEICSDISSDKLNDDLNAGDLRRRASSIIEEEINKIRQSASGTMTCLLDPHTVDAEDDDGDKRKSRKVKKLRQKITVKTSIENPEPTIKAVIEKVEIEETAFEVKPSGISVVVNMSDEVDNKTFRLPLRKKKKLAVVELKVSCDPIESVSVTPPALVMATIEEATAEMKTEETQEAAVNIKTKNADLDTKLLLDKVEYVKEDPGEMKKNKNVVNSKSSEKVEDPTTVPKMNPLRRDPSADDFWGMLGSRETQMFKKRQQNVIEEQKKRLTENSWTEESSEFSEMQPVERKSVLKKNASDKTKTSVTETQPKNAAFELISKVETQKPIEIKAESLQKTAFKGDKAETMKNKTRPSEKLEIVSKAQASNASPAAKVVEPKVKQKSEENLAKIIKSEKPLDAEKLDNVSTEKTSSMHRKKKINEIISLQPTKQAHEEEEKPLKLQPVPKPKQLSLASQKVEENEATPEWKLKKLEEKSPETPKTPPWKKAKDEVKNGAIKIEEKETKNDEPKGEKTEIEAKIEKIPGHALTPQKITLVEVENTKLSLNVEIIPKESKSAVISAKVEVKSASLKVEAKLPEVSQEIDLKLAEKASEIESTVEQIVELKPETGEKFLGNLKAAAKKPVSLKAKSAKDESSVRAEDKSKSMQSKPTDYAIGPKAEIKVEQQTTKLDEKGTVKKSVVKIGLPLKKDLKTVEPKVLSVETPSTKEDSLQSKEKIPESKQPSSITPDQALSTQHKSKVTSADSKKLSTAKTVPDVSDKAVAVDQPTKSTLSEVNDQVGKASACKKKKPLEIFEGQKLKTEEAKVLNENKTTQRALDDPLLVENSSNKSLGTLSKFPTLNNLNSIEVNEASVADNQQPHSDESNNEASTENKTIGVDQTIAKESKIEAQSISVAIEPIKASENKDLSESESEESSYESDESLEEEMEKKPFDPQRKVKLDFSQLKKCFGNDATSNIKLVARPRPLWKIKRNRHAVFSDSETDTSAEEDTRGGSATGSSQSSAESEKQKKKVGGVKTSDEASDNITALMSSLNVQNDNEGDDNGDSELKKKNRLSTSSGDSGIGLGATAAKSPRKAMGESNVKSLVRQF